MSVPPSVVITGNGPQICHVSPADSPRRSNYRPNPKPLKIRALTRLRSHQSPPTRPSINKNGPRRSADHIKSKSNPIQIAIKSQLHASKIQAKSKQIYVSFFDLNFPAVHQPPNNQTQTQYLHSAVHIRFVLCPIYCHGRLVEKIFNTMFVFSCTIRKFIR